jgi:hypothetical protein
MQHIWHLNKGMLLLPFCNIHLMCNKTLFLFSKACDFLQACGCSNVAFFKLLLVPTKNPLATRFVVNQQCMAQPSSPTTSFKTSIYFSLLFTHLFFTHYVHHHSKKTLVRKKMKAKNFNKKHEKKNLRLGFVMAI